METKYFFEYGTTEKYNNRTPERTIAASSGRAARAARRASKGCRPAGPTTSGWSPKNEPRQDQGPGRHLPGAGEPDDRRGPRERGGGGIRPTSMPASTRSASTPPITSSTARRPVTAAATPEVALGSQLDPQLVTAHIEGFEPGVIHFRVVAENQWGTTVSPDSTFSFSPPDCPNSHVRQQTNANYLPDCRAYELVSPGKRGQRHALPGRPDERRRRRLHLPALPDHPSLNPGGAASAPSRFAFIGGDGRDTGAHRAERLHGPLPRHPDHPRLGDDLSRQARGRIPDRGRPQCNLSDGRLHGLPDRTALRLRRDTSPRALRLGLGGQEPRPLADEPGRSCRTATSSSPTTSPRRTSRTTSSRSVNAPFAPGGNEGPPGTRLRQRHRREDA